MTTAEKLTKIAENVPKVYEAGQIAEYDRFWDIYQENGLRKNYNYFGAGSGWTEENFKPKYPVVTNYAYMMFAYTGLTNIDCSEIEFSTGANMQYTFYNQNILKSVTNLDCSNITSLPQTFQNARSIETIELLNLKNDCTFNNTFQNNTQLTNLKLIDCEIGQDVSFQWSENLTAASLLSILTALSKDGTVATGKTIIFAAESGEVINADEACVEQSTLAKNAGWEIKFE